MYKNDNKTMDVNQAALQLRVSRSTIYRLIEQGDLPASRHGTAYCIRIRIEDVETLKKKRQEISKWC